MANREARGSWRLAAVAAGLLAAGLWGAVVAGRAQTEASRSFDVVIRNGHVLDGTGNPWFGADVGIRDGRIAEIGALDGRRATRVIDAAGRIVSPGFFDTHAHVEGDLLRHPEAENYLRMGVTSLVTGNCGFSEVPLAPWFDKVRQGGVSVNVGSLVGHNNVRRLGMNGDFDRPPTPDELARMRALVGADMRSGALGVSTGLEYVPGIYARTDEIAALAREAAAFGGLYATHMRDEGNAIEASIRETLAVGEAAQCPVHISHFKVSAKRRWGFSEQSVALIEQARAAGHQATVDVYVYTAGATYIDIIFPAWVFDGGRDQALARLKDPVQRAKVRQEIVDKAAAQGFEDLGFVQIASYKADPGYNGRRLPEIATARGAEADPLAQADVAIDIRLNGGADVVVHKMADEDVDRIVRQPFAMIGADAGVEGLAGEGNPHPRNFGNNARLLSRYVRQRGLLTLEEAVRRMTSLPAQTFHVWDRGLVRPGFAADLLVFDPARVEDHATFERPRQYSSGFDVVLVNGTIVIDEGRHTGARPGQVLRGTAAAGPGARP
ncbi:MAG: D-aminoacylase [Chloroflexi bacterium]|nr:D-aminoacylase [Chloroflexota bacterium]